MNSDLDRRGFLTVIAGKNNYRPNEKKKTHKPTHTKDLLLASENIFCIQAKGKLHLKIAILKNQKLNIRDILLGCGRNIPGEKKGHPINARSSPVIQIPDSQ